MWTVKQHMQFMPTIQILYAPNKRRMEHRKPKESKRDGVARYFRTFTNGRRRSQIYYRKFTTFHRIPDVRVKALVKAARKWLSKAENCPILILTDQARQFIRRDQKTVGRSLEILMITTSSFNSQGNQVERTMKELERSIRAYCYYKQRKWPQVLKHLERALNMTRSRATGEIPHEVQEVAAVKLPRLLQTWAATHEEVRTKVERARE